jgi:hypothetical protein
MHCGLELLRVRAIRSSSGVFVGGTRQRAALARLLAEMGRVMLAERLIDVLSLGAEPSAGQL